MKKKSKIVFSEEIDNFIDGISLGIAFILIAIFIYFVGIFHNVLVDRIVMLVLILFGFIGTATEISKINNKNKIHGIDNFLIGIIFLGISIFFYIKI